MDKDIILNAVRIGICSAVFCLPDISLAYRAPSRPKINDPALKVDLVFSGTVISRKEIWDRRTNPLMGRPDILKEIILQVNISRVLSGYALSRVKRVDVIIKGQEQLVAFKKVVVGWRGTFCLAGSKSPYNLVDFRGVVGPKGGPQVVNQPLATQAGNTLKSPDNVSGRQIKESKELRGRALKEITQRYGMADSSIVMLTSYQGPVPPEGGYIYWGVKGRVKEEWHIWQGGFGLRPGTELEDPHRYEK